MWFIFFKNILIMYFRWNGYLIWINPFFIEFILKIGIQPFLWLVVLHIFNILLDGHFKDLSTHHAFGLWTSFYEVLLHVCEINFIVPHNLSPWIESKCSYSLLLGNENLILLWIQSKLFPFLYQHLSINY